MFLNGASWESKGNTSIVYIMQLSRLTGVRSSARQLVVLSSILIGYQHSSLFRPFFVYINYGTSRCERDYYWLVAISFTNNKLLPSRAPGPCHILAKGFAKLTATNVPGSAAARQSRRPRTQIQSRLVQAPVLVAWTWQGRPRIYL